jgi:hypothetical protein
MTVLGDWRRACEQLMPAEQQLLPSCVLVGRSNAEMNAFRSTCIRVVAMNKHCNTAAASIVHMYTDKRLHVFLVGRHLSCQYILWMTLLQGVCSLPEYQHLPAKQAAALFSDICALSFMENHNIYHIILSHELRTLSEI